MRGRGAEHVEGESGISPFFEQGKSSHELCDHTQDFGHAKDRYQVRRVTQIRHRSLRFSRVNLFALESIPLAYFNESSAVSNSSRR